MTKGILTLEKFIRLVANTRKKPSVAIKINYPYNNSDVITSESCNDILGWMMDHKDCIIEDFTYGSAGEFLFEIRPLPEQR